MAQYNSPRPNWIRQILWWCAGADPILLRLGTYSDQIKLACMGGTIVSTAILAFLAGTYAIHTIFSIDIAAEISTMEYFLGFVWAVIIFNIDRYIVSSATPKIDVKPWKIIKNAFPRILMGVVISFVISKPLELKIFEKDIELEISKNQGKEFQKIKDDIKHNLENDLKIIDAKLAKYDRDINNLDKEYVISNDLYNKEVSIISEGPRARAYKADREVKLSRINKIKEGSDYKKLIAEKDSLNNTVNIRADKEKVSVQNGLRSLVNKITLSHKISPTISDMITLLFVILELTPILFKILMERSPYDDQMKNRNDIIVENSNVLAQKDREERFRKIEEHKKEQDDLKEQFYKDRERLQTEQELKRDKLLESNTEILKAENDLYLKDSLNNIIDLDKIEEVNKKLKKAAQFAKENVEIELETYMRSRYLEVEKGLLNTSGNEFVKDQEVKIKANPVAEYIKRFHFKENNDDNKKKNKEVQDALIKNKFWGGGENYSNIRILTKNEITELLNNNGNFNAQSTVNELHNSAENKCVTDTKISQSRQDENLIDWMKKNNNIQKFNLDEDKIFDLHNVTKRKINDLIAIM